MQNHQPSVFARDDTFFGVCHAIGEDFGFNPNWLRAAFALALFWNPPGAIGTYVAAGIVVLLSRLLVREPRVALPLPAAAESQPALPRTAAATAAPAEGERLPMAA